MRAHWLLAGLALAIIAPAAPENARAQATLPATPPVVCTNGLMPSPGGECACPPSLKPRNTGGRITCVPAIAETCLGSAHLVGDLCICPPGENIHRNGGGLVSCIATEPH